MAFQRGHRKRGGRRVGTRNKVSGEARAVARGLLDDPAYWKSLKRRLIRGEAPRIELLIWEYGYGKPRVAPDEAPEGADSTADLAQILERLGDPKRQGLSPPPPQVVDLHDSKEDPVPLASASHEAANGGKN